MRGLSGKTLPRPEIPEVLGPTMMGTRNATKKVGTLPGGRPNEGINHTQVADTAGETLTKLTERRQVEIKIDDTVNVNNFQPYMAVIMSPSRQARYERVE